jgi:hypothetical protein
METALSVLLAMFMALFACLFCGHFQNLQWVHHVCFLLFFLYSIYCWQKRRSWWLIIPTVASIGFWVVLDAITFVPIGD